MSEANSGRRLLFRTGRNYYAVVLDTVLEVVGRTPADYRIPDKPSVEIRNTKVPCLPTPWPLSGSTSVVCKTSRGIAVLLVDAVCGIFRSTECQFHPPPLSLCKSELERLIQIIEVKSLHIRAAEINFEVVIEQLDPNFQGVRELAAQMRSDETNKGSSARLILEIPLEDGVVGLRVMDVERILPFRQPSHIAGLPDFALGLINVEGAIVPLLDVARRVNSANTAASTRIVVVMAQGSKWGLSVPRISNLMTLSAHSKILSEHPLGEMVSRGIEPELLLLKPDKLINF